MNEAGYAIIDKNLARAKGETAASVEKSLAHLYELGKLTADAILSETGETDILRAVFHADEASRIYRETLQIEHDRLFAPVNQKEEPFWERQFERFARLYFCRCIAEESKSHARESLQTLIFGETAETPSGGDRKVAFLRNRQTFRAFECFAKTLGGVSVLYENNFGDASEAVSSGQATYAIIPIYSTSDGRLDSFYRMIEKHELSIVLTCDIDSDDGESMTTFALVYRERLAPRSGILHFECKITFEDLSSLSDITDAAFYFGAKVTALEALPVMFSGRAGTYAVIFDLEQADIDGLLCYLALEYPQLSAVGFYGKLPRP